VTTEFFLCKNVSDDWRIIEEERFFSAYDPLVLALLVCKGVLKKTAFEFTWMFGGKIRACNRVDLIPHKEVHRILGYVKTAPFVMDRLYGKWTVTVLESDKMLRSQEFSFLEAKSQRLVVSSIDLRA